MHSNELIDFVQYIDSQAAMCEIFVIFFVYNACWIEYLLSFG